MKKLDAEWFPIAKQIVFDVAEIPRFNRSLDLPRKERELFLSSEVENPRLVYDVEKLNIIPVDERIDQFTSEITSSAADPVLIDLYLKKLERQRERAALLVATAAGDDEAFYEASSVVYGSPKKEYFAYVAERVTELITKYAKAEPEAAKRLKKVFNKISAEQHDVDISVLPTPLETDKKLGSLAEAMSIFQATLDRFKITDWSLAVRESELSHFAVEPESKKVLIPQEDILLARNLSVLGLQALAEHEVGVHVRRNFEAKKQPLLLLQLGLDNYLKGEEGVASYVQQQVEGSREFYGFDRYLAASLAVGMDGAPRDFRAVFSLMTDYYSLRHAERGIETPAFKPAWDVCVRIFRGTTGTTPGAIYTKDIIYLEGNVGIWNLLSEKPHVFESLFLGKYNPLLTRHVKSLQTLGILEEW